MSNNQNDIDHLTSQLALQKDKDRKHLLRIEIAKATDRSVKKALQDILDDIEKKERNRNIWGGLLLIVFLLIGLYFIGTNDYKKDSQLLDISSASSSEIIKSYYIEETTKESEIKTQVSKEKRLTEDEVRQWVSAVWEEKNKYIPSALDYRLSINISDTDNLVYITVLPPKNVQVDSYGLYRINNEGILEESGRFATQVSTRDWVFVSDKFMDTSQVAVREASIPESSINTKDLSSEQAITWVKNYRSQEDSSYRDEELEFEAELSKEGFSADNYLEVSVYSWNSSNTEKSLEAIYRINGDGNLEEGSTLYSNDWFVISTEYIK